MPDPQMPARYDEQKSKALHDEIEEEYLACLPPDMAQEIRDQRMIEERASESARILLKSEDEVIGDERAPDPPRQATLSSEVTRTPLKVENEEMGDVPVPAFPTQISTFEDSTHTLYELADFDMLNDVKLNRKLSHNTIRTNMREFSDKDDRNLMIQLGEASWLVHRYKTRSSKALFAKANEVALEAFPGKVATLTFNLDMDVRFFNAMVQYWYFGNYTPINSSLAYASKKPSGTSWMTPMSDATFYIGMVRMAAVLEDHQVSNLSLAKLRKLCRENTSAWFEAWQYAYTRAESDQTFRNGQDVIRRIVVAAVLRNGVQWAVMKDQYYHKALELGESAFPRFISELIWAQAKLRSQYDG